MLDDALTHGDPGSSVPVLQAKWRSAEADEERRWVAACLQDALHMTPHRTPARVLAAVAEDTARPPRPGLLRAGGLVCASMADAVHALAVRLTCGERSGLARNRKGEVKAPGVRFRECRSGAVPRGADQMS